MYLDNTNLLYGVNSAIGKETHIGTVRELFALSSLEEAGYHVCYTKPGDMMVEGYTLEIGGEGKSQTQIKETSNAFVCKDDILYSSLQTRPLYLLGFLR
jgi:hypothetical protein